MNYSNEAVKAWGDCLSRIYSQGGRFVTDVDAVSHSLPDVRKMLVPLHGEGVRHQSVLNYLAEHNPLCLLHLMILAVRDAHADDELRQLLADSIPPYMTPEKVPEFIHAWNRVQAIDQELILRVWKDLLPHSLDRMASIHVVAKHKASDSTQFLELLAELFGNPSAGGANFENERGNDLLQKIGYLKAHRPSASTGFDFWRLIVVSINNGYIEGCNITALISRASEIYPENKPLKRWLADEMPPHS